MSPPKDLQPPSDRKFGWFFTAVFAVFGIWALTGGKLHGAAIMGGLALVVALITLAKPAALHPFNIAWLWLGYGLGLVVSPIVLAVIFYLVISPVALFTRLVGRDELRIRRHQSESTYWRKRDNGRPTPESFQRQG